MGRKIQSGNRLEMLQGIHRGVLFFPYLRSERCLSLTAFPKSIRRLLFDVKFMLLPGRETAFQFHHRITSAGESGTGIGGQMALLGVAINHVSLVLA